MILKQKIQQAFNKACHDYDAAAVLQIKVCDRLLALLADYLPEKKWGTVLDLGCGTGLSTEALFSQLHCQRLIGIDFAESMLAIARQKIQHPGLTWCVADFEELAYESNSIDLIFSNLSLQWSADLKAEFNRCYHLLQQEGLIVFSVPLENNFPEIKRAHKNLFSSRAQIECDLQKVGFEILCGQEKMLVENFESPLAVLHSLRRTGVTVLLCEGQEKEAPAKIDTIFVEPALNTLTYHVGFFVARKP